MALTSAQIVARACAIAKVPGWTSQAGQYLNAVLQELCQTYDFELAKKTYQFTFQPGLTDPMGLFQAGSGPYALPGDFLRCADEKSVFWLNNGVPYPLVPIDMSEFDMTIQQPGNSSYPYWFAVDLSLGDQTADGKSAPMAYVYPQPSGAYPVVVRYYAQMPDIATPETSATVPWFPNTNYLITRVAGELMKEADDERWTAFLGDGEQGAAGILRGYLQMKDNKTNRAMTVKMDRRRFGPNFSTLPNTKQIYF
jgi:hypothetical protein